MRTRIAGGLAAATLTLALAAPVAATTPEHFGWTDAYDVHHACGIVEHLRVTARGTTHFDADGAWLRDVVHYRFSGVYESTITGRTLTNSTTQTAVYEPDGVTLTGQGAFIRGAGGVLVYDVGRLVSNWDQSTRSGTPKVIRFDDPAANEAVEQALCDALG